MARDVCKCGESLTPAEVEIVERWQCASCGSGRSKSETVDLEAVKLDGVSPLLYVAKRRAARLGDTVEVSPDAAEIERLTEEAKRRADSGRATVPGSTGAGDGSSRITAATPTGSIPMMVGGTAGVASHDATGSIPPPGVSGAGFASGTFLDETGEAFTIGEGTHLGDFLVRGTLGQGGMGVVYLAYEEKLDRDVALKVLSPSLCRNRRFIDRFKREAQAAAGLAHPNITHIYRIDEHAGIHFYAMELVRGKNLVEILGERGAMPAAEALPIIRHSAEGLRAATQHKITHRDVKPSNIMLTESGAVKVTDFGLAKAYMGSLELTSTGVILGTPVYMSPEQGRGDPVDHRSDMYSLGATFYHLIYGKPPFQADSPISLILKHISDAPSFPEDKAARVPRGVVAIIRRLLEKDPDRRYATYDDLLRDLDAVLAGREIAGPATGRGGVYVLPRGRPSGDSTGATRSALRMSKLSVAKANLRLQRMEKALALLREMLSEAEDPDLRTEAALMLLDIYDRDGDIERAREAAQVALDTGRNKAVKAFVCWKLAAYHEREAIDRERRALALYERVLAESPDGLPKEVVARKVKDIRSRIALAERSLGEIRVVLRDSGDPDR